MIATENTIVRCISQSHDDVKRSHMGYRGKSSTSTDTRDQALTGLFRKQEIADLPMDR